MRVNATWRKCPHNAHRIEMKTAISCTILRHTKILIAVGVSIISLATLGSKNHTTNITKIVTQSIGIIIKRLDRKSGSAGMPRPISYAVFCLKKKKKYMVGNELVSVVDALGAAGSFSFVCGRSD